MGSAGELTGTHASGRQRESEVEVEVRMTHKCRRCAARAHQQLHCTALHCELCMSLALLSFLPFWLQNRTITIRLESEHHSIVLLLLELKNQSSLLFQSGLIPLRCLGCLASAT
ncbi:hypothetical protein KC19_6G162400 [Ceratodon purpureus]|uniref:Uncharacterized protein n=1 Tax=Ceratodon purpureus TaxID=3225 RepID=A0A8T0HIF8_CERPU|nr:hypothetical protein KC19_6G162400 [Ceratodon purpureus]